MRIAENLVVQNVGGTKLVLMDDSTQAEMLWPIGDMISNQRLAEQLDYGFENVEDGHVTVLGHQPMGRSMSDGIKMTLAVYGRFVFAAGYLIGASR